MGSEFIFSAECPFGTEDERVMEYAHKVYPALRNRMPEPFLKELNRGNKKNPGSFDKEYVQWQRGGLTKIPVDTMKAWVDTAAANDNIWMVLVFHGVDGIGWEPRTTEDLRTYFKYIKSKEKDVWVATFGKVTKYMRERMNAKLNTTKDVEKIVVTLTHNLDQNLYNEPLTLRTYVPGDWPAVEVKQNEKAGRITAGKDEKGAFIIYDAVPNAGKIEVSRADK
jgi:hypothetical protein